MAKPMKRLLGVAQVGVRNVLGIGCVLRIGNALVMGGFEIMQIRVRHVAFFDDRTSESDCLSHQKYQGVQRKRRACQV